jgi:hypothetical protein
MPVSDPDIRTRDIHISFTKFLTSTDAKVSVSDTDNRYEGKTHQFPQIPDKLM